MNAALGAQNKSLSGIIDWKNGACSKKYLSELHTCTRFRRNQQKNHRTPDDTAPSFEHIII